MILYLISALLFYWLHYWPHYSKMTEQEVSELDLIHETLSVLPVVLAYPLFLPVLLYEELCS